MNPAARQIRMFSLVLTVVLALPLPLGPATGLYLWTSPYIALNSLFAGNALVAMQLLAGVVLIAAAFRARWYCRWICPVGVLCDAASKVRRSNTGRFRFPSFGMAIAAAGLAMAIAGAPLLSTLDPLDIFHSFFDVFRHPSAGLLPLRISGLLLIVLVNLAVPNLWCSRLCPLGGLQDLLKSIRHLVRRKTDRAVSFSAGRRTTLGVLSGFILGLVVRRAAAATRSSPVRPPSALAEERFKAVCIRCGNCARACPAGIIRTSLEPSDWTGWLTPRIVFASGYCPAGCIVCGRVCPSGALRRFAQADKKSLVMGIARIERDGCLLIQNKECSSCLNACEYDAVIIRRSDADFAAWPEILAERCVGCGACAVACPVSVISIAALNC